MNVLVFRCALLLPYVCLTLLCGVAQAAEPSCRLTTHKAGDFTVPEIVFSPYERVFAIIRCDHLEPGEYNLHANWVNQKRGLIRSDSLKILQEQPEKRMLYFWFKLGQNSSLVSAFTNKDFNPELFGEWQVELYINDGLVASEKFELLP